MARQKAPFSGLFSCPQFFPSLCDLLIGTLAFCISLAPYVISRLLIAALQRRGFANFSAHFANCSFFRANFLLIGTCGAYSPLRSNTAQKLKQLGGQFRRFVQQFKYPCHIVCGCRRLNDLRLYGFLLNRLLMLIEHLFKLVGIQSPVLIDNVGVIARLTAL